MSEMMQKAVDEKFCGDCGAIIKIRAEICPKCGVRQVAEPKPQVVQRVQFAQRRRGSAMIWAFFLGGLGAHKFYLGRVGTGFAYLIFFWTFIPAIISLIDFIQLAVMSDEKFDAEYNVAG